MESGDPSYELDYIILCIRFIFASCSVVKPWLVKSRFGCLQLSICSSWLLGGGGRPLGGLTAAADCVELLGVFASLVSKLRCILFHPHHSLVVDMSDGTLAVRHVADVHRGTVAIGPEHARTAAGACSISRYLGLVSVGCRWRRPPHAVGLVRRAEG